MKRFFLLPLFAVLFGSAASLFADGFIIIDETHWQRPPHPGPVPVRVYAPLEVTYHHVNVKIDGQIATTSVDQEFYNPNPQRLEGTYLFPIPKGGQIDKFTMEIGGQQVQAELLSADKARAIYEDIVRKLKDPALLEYAGRDVFKVRVFPIEPNSRKRITLSYSQVLPSDAGLISYVLSAQHRKIFRQADQKRQHQSGLANQTAPSKPSIRPATPSRSSATGRTGPPSASKPPMSSRTPISPSTSRRRQDEVGLNLLTS